MSTKRVLRKQQLFDNPTPRMPICLVLDCSPSMSGRKEWGAAEEQLSPTPIEELNDGVRRFLLEVQSDDIAANSAEVSIVRYADTALEEQDFASVQDLSYRDLELMGGGTSIGTGVDLGLALLDARKAEYQSAGVDYYQPWLVLMTDGAPTDKSHLTTAREVQKRASANKLVVFPVGIGRGADMDTLALFATAERPPLKLKGLRFADFFLRLSQSIQQVSRSIPGEASAVPTGPDWTALTDPDEPWED